MSSIGGEIGGKIGNSQNPFFTSPGGVTPQQADLAQYDYGQSLLADIGQFEPPSQPGGGAMHSTMVTQAAGGAGIGKGLELAHLSDVDQEAQFAAHQNALNIQNQNQTSAINAIGQLGKLASAAAGDSSLVSGLTTGITGG